MSDIVSPWPDQVQAEFQSLVCQDLPGLDIQRITSKTVNGQNIFFITGHIHNSESDCICPHCAQKMTKLRTRSITLNHILFNSACYIKAFYDGYRCENKNCDIKTIRQKVSFKSEHHRMTKFAEKYITELTSKNIESLAVIAYRTNCSFDIVRAINFNYLLLKYTDNIEGKYILKKPSHYSVGISIDEFLLHKGNRYATVIMDILTGEVLWVAEGKTKSIIYKFIEHVGQEWMSHVKFIVTDMNADFQQAFRDKCQDGQFDSVYDRFHLIHNFNDIIDRIRREIKKSLNNNKKDNNNKELLEVLKHSKYILYADIEKLELNDLTAEMLKLNKNKNNYNGIFTLNNYELKGGQLEKYNKLVNEFDIFRTINNIKKLLKKAYNTDSIDVMKKCMKAISKKCEKSNNEHLLKFKKIIDNHFDGIVNYAKYKITTGRHEGFNNKIKTLRRFSYCLSNKEYFFLKIMDISRSKGSYYLYQDLKNEIKKLDIKKIFKNII